MRRGRSQFHLHFTHEVGGRNRRGVSGDEPARVPLQKGIMAGHWFDLQASWAAAAGLDPSPTCEQVFGSNCGPRRDVFLGCLLSSAALGWCRVLDDRWLPPHHSVRASFRVGGWSARFCQPVRYSVVWPAAWVSAIDKARSSKSAEVTSMMNACSLFILVFGTKFAPLPWLVNIVEWLR